MNLKHKHIEIFESKKIAIQAATMDNYVDGARLINDFLQKNHNDIVNSMKLVKTDNTRSLYIEDLLYPFYNRFGKDILDSTLDDLDTGNDNYVDDIPSDDAQEYDDLEIDF